MRKVDMTRAANTQGLFKPRLSGSEVKAKVTTEAARSIIRNEAALREEKTRRLRAARLAKEAKEQISPEPLRETPRKRTR
jgi:hypothetical protein